MYVPATGAVAARHKQQLEEEEQRMTSYEPRELAEDWEFKILRSMTGAFKNPHKMREVLDEEEQLGPRVLLEQAPADFAEDVGNDRRIQPEQESLGIVEGAAARWKGIL